MKDDPAGFRTEFGAEMQQVFLEGVEDRLWDGLSAALVFCMCELRDFPGNFLRQRWVEYRKKRSMMNSLSINLENSPLASPGAPRHLPGRWRAAFLAGLPHLLMAALIGVGKFLPATAAASISNTILATMGALLSILFLIVLFAAWRWGWPLWSASWYLYGAWGGLALLNLAVMRLDLVDDWRYTNALYAGWFLFCALGYGYLLLKDSLRGLMAVAFLFPFLGILLQEFKPDAVEGGIAIGLGLLAFLGVGAVVRLGSLRAGVGLVAGLNLVAGLALAYTSVYQMKDLPAGIPPPSPRFSDFLAQLSFYLVIAFGILAAPFVLRGLWNLGKRRLSP